MRSLGRVSSIGGITRRSDIVRQLAAMLAAREEHRAPGGSPVPRIRDIVATGWDAIDRVLAPALPRAVDSDAIAHVGHGGLRRGEIHEWLGHEEPCAVRRRWRPPHSLLIHLAERAIEADDDTHASSLIVWIGRRVWPQARAMTGLLGRAIFLDPPDDASRLWAIDLALRSPASGVVIADASRVKMAESRRLQLAAERGRALALLARPAWERPELSAAATRWGVRRMVSLSSQPRWVITLLRCRAGVAGLASQLAGRTSGGWEMEYASQGHVRLVADVVDRPGSPRVAEIRAIVAG